MTYRPDCTFPVELLDQIVVRSLDVPPAPTRTIIDAAMQIERQNHPGVAPYKRSPESTPGPCQWL